MKRITAIILMIILVFALAACSPAPTVKPAVSAQPTATVWVTDGTQTGALATDTPATVAPTTVAPTTAATPTATPTPETILYYDQSRVKDSSLTLEYVVAKALENGRHMARYSGEENFAYTTDFCAECMKDMDIFGYGLTKEEMIAYDWGSGTFSAVIDNEEYFNVEVVQAGFTLDLPFKTKEELLTAVKRDTKKFTDFTEGICELTVGGTLISQMNQHDLTIDERIEKAADANGNSVLMRSDAIEVAGVEVYLSLNISTWQVDGIYRYELKFFMQF